MANVMTFEDVLEFVDHLPIEDKVRLAEHLAPWIRKRLPRRSLYGIVKHLGPAPSAEEIDEMRHEVWSNFPRDDI